MPQEMCTVSTIAGDGATGCEDGMGEFVRQQRGQGERQPAGDLAQRSQPGAVGDLDQDHRQQRDHQRGDQDRDPEQTADAAGAGQKAHGTRF